MFKRKPKIFRFNPRGIGDFFVTIRSRGQAPFRGQATIETTFSIVVIIGLMLGMIKVFSWVSRDLSSRRAAHEQTLVSPVVAGNIDDTYRQIRPIFYEGTPIDAATINSEIFGLNRL